jgi:hypothetical protein
MTEYKFEDDDLLDHPEYKQNIFQKIKSWWNLKKLKKFKYNQIVLPLDIHPSCEEIKFD